MDIYRSTVRPLLFYGLKLDPEWAHHRALQLLSWIDQNQSQSPINWVESQLRPSFCLQDVRLQQKLWGLTFNNPVGLAAGFDKDGVAAGIWQSLGFGFTELGTVTLHPQPGNPQPRLFRLVEDQAVLNRMGFNNLGAEILAQRLQEKRQQQLMIPIGINLGKSKITPLEAAAEDYLGSFKLLKNYGDYFVVNVSSPNTPGLRSLQDAEQLSKIIEGLKMENTDNKPIFIKIAPDLEWDAIADVVHLSQTHKIAGIIATNTTIKREGLKTQWLPQTGSYITEEAGGISGAPLKKRSTEVIRWIYQNTQGQLPIIGVGGIFTADDAWEKITAGACLIQVYTGWVYEGPGMVKRILEGLLQKLDQYGLKSISEAVGFKP
ncbi:quinone-dependent dihydroorotate dehydrogenase [Planktothrix sp. FACHB-1365]|uniref:quinone-dependent dihydroorotate dehydrogenase n=1 Tax=Planktothrix sp. FACHB-1365 TaxID=2692855 RepID=UPI0016887C9C|nr:quinone-dependent dihydroorotate dehydrogenase [Planktothrix sp. FACHB-1365]MBD2483254.1 quinone-dependent dihydroorotate dehydrogenase [Planktothrix sp. FACHB-1365]